jgi:phospholipid/cholesterol/gamma-HCH transport system substrate-binding protein
LDRRAKVGLLLLGGIITLYLAVAWARGSGVFAVSQETYYVRYNNINGLRRADPVTFRGLQVGQVAALTPQRQGILVTLSIAPDLPLRADTRTRIEMKELMGGKKLALLPGQGQQPLRPGDTLQGTTAFDIPSAVDQFGSFSQQLPTEAIPRLITRIDTLTRRLTALTTPAHQARLKATLSEFQQSARQLNRLTGQMQEARLIQQLGSTLRTVQQLAGQVDRGLARFDTLAGDFQATMPQLRATGRRLDTVLAGTDTLIAQLNQLTAQAQNQGTAAHKLLQDRQFAQQLDQLLQQFDQTLTKINRGELEVYLRLGQIQQQQETQ